MKKICCLAVLLYSTISLFAAGSKTIYIITETRETAGEIFGQLKGLPTATIAADNISKVSLSLKNASAEARFVNGKCTLTVKLYALEQYKRKKDSNVYTTYHIKLKALLSSDSKFPDLVISVATAASPNSPRNGHIYVGNKFFVHGEKIGNKRDSSIVFFRKGWLNVPCNALNGAPVKPAASPACHVDSNNSTVTELSLGKLRAPASYKQIAAKNTDQMAKWPPKSVENIHGLVAYCASQPVIFVSGITHTYGYNENSPAQQKVLAGNMGRYLAAVVSKLRTEWQDSTCTK